MRLLLDTHTLLWWRDASPRLPQSVADEIGDPTNDIVISITSLWEIAIKRAVGKLRFPERFEDVMAEEGFRLLPIAYEHLRELEALPRRHRDPFDRLLIAQSIAENLPIATNDKAFGLYSVSVFW
jgi:PIN domain nuclease of toxin-antitoxin system